MVLQNPSLEEEIGDAGAKELRLDMDAKAIHFRTKSEGCLCFGNAHRIDKLLATSHYEERMPVIPKEELYASSVQHPRHPNYRWLLNTRRVPMSEQVVSTEHVGGSVAAAPSDEGMAPEQAGPSCAGVGVPEKPVWLCRKC